MKIRTKNLIGILVTVILAAGILSLAGCSLTEDQESIEDVIQKFVAAVNDDNIVDIQACLDDAADSSDTALTTAFLVAYMPSTPYTVISIDEKSGNYAAATLRPDGGGADIPFYFQMTDKSGTFYIRRIWLGSNDSTEPIFQ